MGKITLNLLENGLDFLCEALTPIVQTQDERKLKYSVLNICAGVELILKAVLFRADWRQIFQRPEHAKREDLTTGRFASVKFRDMLDRLEAAGVVIDARVKNHLQMLRDKRNMIEHYAMYEETAAALRGNISVVLDDVIALMELQDVVDTEREDQLYEKLLRNAAVFEEYNAVMRKRLIPDYEKLITDGASFFQCPKCFQMTLQIFPGEDGKCCFCRYIVSPEHLADQTLERIEEIDGYSTIKDGGEYPLYMCPLCRYETLVRKKDGKYVCFNCHEHWNADGLSFCMRCGEIYETDKDGPGMCPDCIDYLMNVD